MARGTRLWQSPGSPVIQGRSKHENAFLSELFGALAVAVVSVVAYLLVVTSREDVALPWSTSLTALASGIGLGFVPMGLGLTVARAARSKYAWFVAGVIGALAAVGTARFGFGVQ